MIYNPKEKRECVNPKCSNPVEGRTNKKYCDIKCKDRHKKSKKRQKTSSFNTSAFAIAADLYHKECQTITTAIATDSDEKQESKKRKDAPVFTGFAKYFPNAIMEVARLSKAANDKHNPNEPLHWSKDKSNDHSDCLMRHQLEVGTIDTDGFDHAVKVAWRAMAQLEILLTKE